jgi:YidC/Oxa1 family membrane protein insertase
VDRDKNLVLLGPRHRYAAQSGLIGEGLPNHKTPYKANALNQNLEAGQEKLEVRLEATTANGSKVSKVISFSRGSYLIDVAHQVSNGGNAPLSTHAYMQLTRDSQAPDGENAMMYTYTGPALYTDQDKFRKVPFDDIDSKPFSKTSDNGWVAIVQHHFVTAIVAPERQSRELYTRKLGDDLYTAGVITPLPQIAPGTTQTAKFSCYAGPQEQDKLKAIAPGLELVVDYGMLAVIAVPLFWILQFFHNLSGNWGLAIIFLTVLIKLIFYPLSAASYRSMAKMKLVTPRLMKIREQYANDRMKQNQAMMELYKEEKINPLGGCLPILVQIPVFIALYWTLLGSVELRQAPFYGWITDLASADPYYILPALMMVSMIIQTKMSPAPPDPVQAKVMQIMPIVFGVMFFIFPAGLVLYWLVNNVLSILQQWYITRSMEQAKPAAAKR